MRYFTSHILSESYLTSVVIWLQWSWESTSPEFWRASPDCNRRKCSLQSSSRLEQCCSLSPDNSKPVKPGNWSTTLIPCGLGIFSCSSQSVERPCLLIVRLFAKLPTNRQSTILCSLSTSWRQSFVWSASFSRAIWSIQLRTVSLIP